ncbi:MAG: hypothetical protein ACI9QN_002316 [Arcticibacterium sp.]
MLIHTGYIQLGSRTKVGEYFKKTKIVESEKYFVEL